MATISESPGGSKLSGGSALIVESTLDMSSAGSGTAASHSTHRVAVKPASDVVAGAVARAASQSTIHPLDTIKVRL